jgi:2-phosphoglycerate kinase
MDPPGEVRLDLSAPPAPPRGASRFRHIRQTVKAEGAMAGPVLTVIAGGPETGKSLIAVALVAYRGQAMIARDHVRKILRLLICTES